MMVTLRTSGGSPAVVDADAGEQLASLSGSLLTPDSPGYDEARTIWNAMIDRRPGLIVRCADHGRRRRARSASPASTACCSRVRGGGHNIAGNAVCDGGLMIDLSPMRSVAGRPGRAHRPGRRRRDAGRLRPRHPGARPGDAARHQLHHRHRRAHAGRRLRLAQPPLRASPSTTCSRPRSCPRAGEWSAPAPTENPDLFWAHPRRRRQLRRRHVVRLPAPSGRAGGAVRARRPPARAARDVLRFYRDFLPTTPDEFSCWFVLRKAPPLPFLPAEWHGKEILALAMCYSGRPRGRRARGGAAPAVRQADRATSSAPIPTPHGRRLRSAAHAGRRNYWKSHDFLDAERRAHRRADRARRDASDPSTEIAFAPAGRRGDPGARADATAYSHRDAQFVMNVHGRWADPAKDQRCIGWARDLFRAARRSPPAACT